MTVRRTFDVEPMRPGKRIAVRINLAKALRQWADSDPTGDPIEHAERVTEVAHLLDEAQRIVADDRALAAASLWQSGVRQVDVAELLCVSRTRLTQLLDRASGK